MHQTLHTPQRALTASQGREQPVLVSCQCDIGGLTAIESPPAPSWLPGEGQLWPHVAE